MGIEDSGNSPGFLAGEQHGCQRSGTVEAGGFLWKVPFNRTVASPGYSEAKVRKALVHCSLCFVRNHLPWKKLHPHRAQHAMSPRVLLTQLLRLLVFRPSLFTFLPGFFLLEWKQLALL